MTNILKDVEEVASAAAGMRTRLIAIVGGAIVLFIVAMALANHFENRGRQLERADWLKKEADERAADLALVRKHDADMKALDDHHKEIERKTSEKHETELAQLRLERDADRRRADAAGGLRIHVDAGACAPGGAVVGPEAPGTGRRDDTGAGTVRLPQQVENDLWSIADDADEVSARLRACQGWIRNNGFYGPESSEKAGLLDRMIAVPNPAAEEPTP